MITAALKDLKIFRLNDRAAHCVCTKYGNNRSSSSGGGSISTRSSNKSISMSISVLSKNHNVYECVSVGVVVFGMHKCVFVSLFSSPYLCLSLYRVNVHFFSLMHPNVHRFSTRPGCVEMSQTDINDRAKQTDEEERVDRKIRRRRRTRAPTKNSLNILKCMGFR